MVWPHPKTSIHKYKELAEVPQKIGRCHATYRLLSWLWGQQRKAMQYLSGGSARAGDPRHWEPFRQTSSLVLQAQSSRND